MGVAAVEREAALKSGRAALACGVDATGYDFDDAFRADTGEFCPWPIRVNTVFGMTDHSRMPMTAKAAGVEFDELVWRILETSLAPA